MTQPGIEPRSSGLLANTLLIRPVCTKSNTSLFPLKLQQTESDVKYRGPPNSGELKVSN